MENNYKFFFLKKCVIDYSSLKSKQKYEKGKFGGNLSSKGENTEPSSSGIKRWWEGVETAAVRFQQ